MKKRILSALLALCMVFALGTVGAMASEEPETATGDTLYVSEDGVESDAATDETEDFKWLGAAIDHAESGDTIIIQYSFTAGNTNVTPGDDPTGIYNIDKDLTIKGEGNVTITAGGSGTTRDIHLFNITSGEVTIENITIEGANTTSSHPIKHGIHVYNTADVTLKDVTVNNCYGYGLVVNNGGSVEATDFKASENGWGGVNVDAKSSTASLTMTNSTVTGNGSEKDVSVVLDSKIGGENTVELVGGTYNKVMTNTKDEKGAERSVGTSNVTISKSKIDNLSLNGTGTDKVQIKDDANIGTISGSNSQSGSTVSVTESTVTSTPAGNLGFTLTYVNANVGDKTGVTSDGIVATIDGQGYPTLKSALEAAIAEDDDVTIELLKDDNLGGANFAIKNNITINGNGNKVTVSTANGVETRAFTVDNAKFTLNDVDMTISNGLNTAGNYDGTAFEVKNNGAELVITGGSVVTAENLNKGFVFVNTVTDSSKLGKVTVNSGSTLNIKNVDGNGSNGGAWVVDSATITVDDCGNHGLSTESFTTSGNAKVDIKNTQWIGLYGSKMNIDGSTELTVTNCGIALPKANETYEPGYGYTSPIQIKSTGNLFGSPSMTVAKSAQVTVTGTKDGNDTIFVPDNATYESASANVSATIKTKEAGEDETPDIYVVNYVVNGKIVYTESTNNASYKVSHPSEVNAETTNFDCWLVGTEKYAPGTTITLTASTTNFTAQYTTPADPTYTVTIGALSNGGASANKSTGLKVGETVTVTLAPNTGYKVGTVTTTPTTEVKVTGNTATFKMPASNVTVNVTFTATTTPEEPAKSYSIVKNSTSHGSISAPTSGTAGEYYVVTFNPAYGYKLDTFSFTAADGSYVSRTQVGENAYSVKMPNAQLYISATFKLDNEFDINLNYNSRYGDVEARVDGKVVSTAMEDDKVYIYTDPNKGYIVTDLTVSINAWDDVNVKLEREGVYSFIMPDEDVTVKVTFAPGYEIIIDDDIRYGEITTDPEDYAAEDDTVEVYFKPSNGYKLKTLEVFTGKDFDDKVTVKLHSSGDYYRFTMPDGDVYITAEFERTTMPFTDVRTSDWYYSSVLYVYNNGLMEGVSSYSFNPSGTMTREMFWAVLGRIDGQTITGSNWASQARSWAMNKGVSDGTNPTSLITREEMVTMLWRYAGSRAASGGLSRFSDASTISSWASTAMSWAVNNGIIDGVTSTSIQPKGTANRAQCAAIFMRYDQM